MATNEGALLARRVGVRYDAAEDRLLLTLRDTADAGQSYWLTRRLALRLWSALRETPLSPEPGIGDRTAARRTSTPEGSPPLIQAVRDPVPTTGIARLLTRVRVLKPKGRFAVTFEADGGLPATMIVDARGLSRLRDLLGAAIRRARWLSEAAGPTGQGTTPASGPGGSRRLH